MTLALKIFMTLYLLIAMGANAFARPKMTTYHHVCHLESGESPWRTFLFAPKIYQETNDLASMFSLLIAQWTNPQKWKVPHHSLKVNFYPINDYMVRHLKTDNYNLDPETSFVGEFTDLKGATAFVIFPSDKSELILLFKYESEENSRENFREARYNCEEPNPRFSRGRWLQSTRFGLLKASRDN
jgi:hypothetical protein